MLNAHVVYSTSYLILPHHLCIFHFSVLTSRTSTALCLQIHQSTQRKFCYRTCQRHINPMIPSLNLPCNQRPPIRYLSPPPPSVARRRNTASAPMPALQAIVHGNNTASSRPHYPAGLQVEPIFAWRTRSLQIRTQNKTIPHSIGSASSEESGMAHLRGSTISTNRSRMTRWSL